MWRIKYIKQRKHCTVLGVLCVCVCVEFLCFSDTYYFFQNPPTDYVKFHASIFSCVTFFEKRFCFFDAIHKAIENTK